MSANRILVVLAAVLAWFPVVGVMGQTCDVKTFRKLYVGQLPEINEHKLRVRQMPIIDTFITDQQVFIGRVGGDCKPKVIFEDCSEFSISPPPSGSASDLQLAIKLKAKTIQLGLNAVWDNTLVDHLESDPWQINGDTVTLHIYLLDQDVTGAFGKKTPIINKYYWVEAYDADCPASAVSREGKSAASSKTIEPKKATIFQTDVTQGHEGKP